MANKLSIKDATREWVKEFNAIPQQFISEALGDRLVEEFIEQFPDLRVCTFCGDTIKSSEHEELIAGDEEEIKCPSCKNVCEFVSYADDAMENKDYLPMWGTMWTFDTSLDDDWVQENLDTVYQCGFRVYEHENLGIIIGIDGGGYDFYEAHWIPLYKARGLRWHFEEEQ